MTGRWRLLPLALLVAPPAEARVPFPGRTALIERLASPSPLERHEALATMEKEICWDEHPQVLSEALERARARPVRLALVKKLGSLALPPRTPPLPGLVRVLDEGDVEVRLEVLKILHKAGPWGAFAAPGVIKALADPDPRVRVAAALALRFYYQHLPAAAVAPLGQQLLLPDQEQRRTALDTLAYLPDTRPALAGLLAVLADPGADLASRRQAAELLGASGAVEAVPPLEALLAAPDVEDRRAAAGALRALARAVPANDIRPALLRAHDDEDRMVKLRGAEGLAALGALEVAVPTLRRLLFTRHGGAQGEAIEAVKRLGPAAAAAAPELVALALMPTEHLIEEMRGDGREERRRDAVEALVAVGGKAALPHVLPHLRSREEWVRYQALELLAALGPAAAGAEGAVLPLLRDPDNRVRRTAAWLLPRLARSRSLVPTLARQLGDPSPDVAEAAARALGELGAAAAGATGALAARLRDPQKERAVLAGEALARLGPAARPAGPALRRALGDPRTRVRLAAAQALAASELDVRAGVAALTDGLAATQLSAADRAGERYPEPRGLLIQIHLEAARRLLALAEHPPGGDPAQVFDAAALRGLAGALVDPDQGVRTAAATALDHLGTLVEPVLPQIIAAFSAHPEQAGYAREMHPDLCHLLARFGARASAALPAMVEAFYRSANCSEALVAIGREAPAALIPRLRARFDDQCPGRYGPADEILRKLGPP